MFKKVTYKNKPLRMFESDPNKPFLPMDLQFFADGDPDPDDPNPDDDPKPDDPPKKVELTEDELQKKIEAESDRKLSKALEKKQKEWEAQLDQKIADAKKDAEDYAKMTQKEKDDADIQRRMDELEKRERELNDRQLFVQIESDLKDNGLPAGFADSLLSLQDNEKIKGKITEIKKTFDEAVNAAVKEQLRQDTPKAQGGSNDAKNPWKTGQINLTEQAKIFKEDPAKAKLLMEQAK